MAPGGKRIIGDITVIKAIWEDINYNITVIVEDPGRGTVYADPESGNNGPVITLTAEPNPGYKFKRWQRIAGMMSGGYVIPHAVSAACMAACGLTIRSRRRRSK